MSASFGSTDRLQEFVRAAIGMPVIWSHQNAPRPPRPYATIRILSDVMQGFSNRSPLDQDNLSTITTHDQVTTSIQVFSRIDVDPREALTRAQMVQRALSRPSQLLQLIEGGWAFVRILLGPQDISELVDSTWQPRASLDIQWRVARSVIDDLGFVDEIKISGSVEDIDVFDNETIPE